MSQGRKIKLIYINCIHNNYYCPCSISLLEMITCDAIVEKCIVMNLSAELGMVFVSHFPNVLEVD